jgi:hypothetical protein
VRDVAGDRAHGGTVAPVSTADLLDFAPGIGGQRAEDFIFELLDASHNLIGTLAAVESPSAPQVTFDTNRSTMRTCTGIQIATTDLAHIDVRRDRVRPQLILQNGARESLGVFMFGDDVRDPHLWGISWKPALFDEGFLLSQAAARTVSLAPGGSIIGLLAQVLNEVGITLAAGVADRPTPTALTFPPTTPRIDIVNALAGALGGFPPFLNRDGVCVLKPIPADGAGPDHVYEFGGRIIEGSTSITNSNYKAPNLYIVTNGDPNAPVIGQYALPPSAPNSSAVTGEVITNTSTFQGMTAAVANDVARAVALTDTSSYTQGTFSSLVDPRHDGFDIVQLFGELYIETGFGISCVPGGPMTHNLTGIYS